MSRKISFAVPLMASLCLMGMTKPTLGELLQSLHDACPRESAIKDKCCKKVIDDWNKTHKEKVTGCGFYYSCPKEYDVLLTCFINKVCMQNPNAPDCKGLCAPSSMVKHLPVCQPICAKNPKNPLCN
jgi:hypothetical protein